MYAGLEDQLNIETPELVDIQFAIAGVGSRFLAVLTDTLIQIVSLLLLTLLFVLIAYSVPWTAPDPFAKWIAAGLILIYFLLYWGYYSLFETFWNGQTPGKRAFHIRVVKDTGRQITLFEALARNLVRAIDWLPGIYLVGFITMMCNQQQKRLGDLIAGTIVVHEQRDEQPLVGSKSRTITAGIFEQPVAEPPLQMPDNLIPADAISRLAPHDLQTIEAFLARALDFDLTVRAKMAAKVASQISARMNYPLSEGASPERFLEAVAFAMRSQSRF